MNFLGLSVEHKKNGLWLRDTGPQPFGRYGNPIPNRLHQPLTVGPKIAQFSLACFVAYAHVSKKICVTWGMYKYVAQILSNAIWRHKLWGGFKILLQKLLSPNVYLLGFDAKSCIILYKNAAVMVVLSD